MTTPKKRGRPPLDPEGQPSVHYTMRLGSKQFDALCARARAERETLPQFIRRTLDPNCVPRK